MHVEKELNCTSVFLMMTAPYEVTVEKAWL
jgi:hypothetical protein